MHLTAVEFAKLITDLRCDKRPSDRRLNPRAPTRKHVEVVRVQPGKALPTSEWLRVRDISRNGIGLMKNDRPESHRMLVLLPKTASETFVLLCEITRMTRLSNGAYGVGVRLVRRVSEEERAAFMRGCTATRAALLTDAAVANPDASPATTAAA